MSWDEPIGELIKKSSLASEGARQLRSRTSADELRKVQALRRLEDEGTEHVRVVIELTVSLDRCADLYRRRRSSERLKDRRWLPFARLTEMAELAGIMATSSLLSEHLRSDGPVPGDDTRTDSSSLWDLSTLGLANDLLLAVTALRRFGPVGPLFGATLSLLARVSQLAEESDRELLDSTAEFAESATRLATERIGRAFNLVEESLPETAETSSAVFGWDASDQLRSALASDAETLRNNWVVDPVFFSLGVKRGIEVIIDSTRDMVDANLSRVDLTGLPLDGVRWSTNTRWANQWRQLIREQSVELRPGLYEINPHSRLRAVKVS